jgi:hypothetical protein
VSDTSHAEEESRKVAAEAGQATQQVAQTAKDQAGTVAQDTRQQIGDVTSEAKAQAKAVAADTRQQLREQADAQAAKVAESMRRLSGEFRALCEGRAEDASTVLPYLQEVSGPLEQFASRIDNRGFDGVVDDVQRFARRRPTAFLAAAAGAGFLAGRMFRSVKDEHAEPEPSVTTVDDVRGSATASLSQSEWEARS